MNNFRGDFFDGEIGQTIAFLAGEGGVFTRRPPRDGFYLDLRDGAIWKGAGTRKVAFAEKPPAHPGGFPFYSTHLSRNGGSHEIWAEDRPASLIRKGTQARSVLREPQEGLTGVELVDLTRFGYEIKKMTSLDLRSARTCYVYDGRLLYKYKGGIRVGRIFALTPREGDWACLDSTEEASFRLSTEPAGGRWTRDFSSGMGDEKKRPLFTLDRGGGLLLLREKEVVGGGFPRSRKGGVSWFTDWSSFPGVAEPIEQREWVGTGRRIIKIGGSGAMLDLEKIPARYREFALIEALNGLCHLEGPKASPVARGRSSTRLMVGEGRRRWEGGAWLSTEGERLSPRIIADWKAIRKKEITSLALLAESAGMEKHARFLIAQGGDRTRNKKTHSQNPSYSRTSLPHL
jgi:hypothetical protein